jgi:hypothetical protein
VILTLAVIWQRWDQAQTITLKLLLFFLSNVGSIYNLEASLRFFLILYVFILTSSFSLFMLYKTVFVVGITIEILHQAET